MDLKDYQEKAFSTCTSKCYTDDYLDLGYLSEVGELAGKLAKRVRGDNITDTDIMYEIGDIAWMIVVYARLHKRKPVINKFLVLGLKDISVFSLAIYATVEMRLTILKVVTEKLGFDFNECLRMNIEKLSYREKNGKIMGNGDYR